MVRKGQVIFALTNPAAEIDPEAALAAGAAFAADGTSINNVLGYPGIFKGALLAGASEINLEMKRAAAWALAGLTVSSELIPEVLDRKVHEVVTEAVRQAAIESGVADPSGSAPSSSSGSQHEIRRTLTAEQHNASLTVVAMRAVRFDRYGDRDVLYVADVDVPEPAAGEVLVEVRAAAINPGEASIRKGLLDERFPATFPSGEGTDLAGVVTAVGDGVSEFAPGDEVLGWSWQRSSHADYVTVPASQLVTKPEGLSWEVAGSLNVAGATAWAAVAAVEPQPGETVGVSAAAGGVGSIAVQLLRMRGARVIGIASAANHAWLLAHDVIGVEYGDGLEARVRDAAPDGLDAFVDTFGPEYVDLALALGVAPERIDTVTAFAAGGRGRRANRGQCRRFDPGGDGESRRARGLR